MKPLANFIGTVLAGALALLAAPEAQAQAGVIINIGPPAWGPQVPYGTQYYYIPEIDGYYDLYSQQYIVYDDGYWVPLPQLYGYDPYRFHPVVIAYRGREPWCQRAYYHQRYAYQPYCNYGRGGSGNGYYGYGHNRYPNGGYYGRGYNRYPGGHNGYDRDDRDHGNGHGRREHDDHDERGYGYRGGQPQYPGNDRGPRGGSYGGQSQSPLPISYGNGPGGSGQAHDGPGNGPGNNGQDQGGGRHGRD